MTEESETMDDEIFGLVGEEAGILFFTHIIYDPTFDLAKTALIYNCLVESGRIKSWRKRCCVLSYQRVPVLKLVQITVTEHVNNRSEDQRLRTVAGIEAMINRVTQRHYEYKEMGDLFVLQYNEKRNRFQWGQCEMPQPVQNHTRPVVAMDPAVPIVRYTTSKPLEQS